MVNVNLVSFFPFFFGFERPFRFSLALYIQSLNALLENAIFYNFFLFFLLNRIRTYFTALKVVSKKLFLNQCIYMLLCCNKFM